MKMASAARNNLRRALLYGKRPKELPRILSHKLHLPPCKALVVQNHAID